MVTYTLIIHESFINDQNRWEIAANILVDKLDFDGIPSKEEVINVLLENYVISKDRIDDISVICDKDVIKIVEKGWNKPIASFYHENNDEWKEKLLRDYTVYCCILNNDGEVIDYDYVYSIEMANPTKEKVLSMLGELITDGCNADVFISDELITVHDGDYKPLFDLIPSSID